MKSNQELEIAKLGRTVGLRGDLKLHLLCDFVSQFKKDATFSTQKRGELTISHFDKNRMQIRFKGYENKEDAQTLVNTILLSSIERSRKECELKKDEFFWFDIIGLNVIENDLKLGSVKSIERIGEQDYLCITTNQELVNKGFSKSFLIPYIDRFIIQTKLTDKLITTQNSFDLLKSS